VQKGRCLQIRLLAALLIGVSVDLSGAQSFNCRDAKRADEVLICQDAQLSSLDEQLAGLYAKQRQRLDGAQRQTFQDNQRVWLRQRTDCGRDRNCVANLYEERIKKLTVDVALPAAVGDCVATTISAIGDRFGERLREAPAANTTGTGISFSNGAYQVSYEWEAAVARSRKGDQVRMCLASIPRKCPPGDERGRKYTTTNLRTGEAWTLPDSQHMCGGA
jgi:uncharacterized protein YecT (DUF1311 family)